MSQDPKQHGRPLPWDALKSFKIKSCALILQVKIQTFDAIISLNACGIITMIANEDDALPACLCKIPRI